MDLASELNHSLSPHPDNGAWAEMLARVSQTNVRLVDLVNRRWPPRAGTAILTELERERSRIARELHAGAGQPLAGIKLHLEMLDECVEGMPGSIRETIARLQTLADQALGQVRAVSHRLQPPEWQELKLHDAMSSLIESSGLRQRMKLTVDLSVLPAEPGHTSKVQLYRCAQECISNIMRHAEATEVHISLMAEQDNIVLTVMDNGRGFDASSRHMGLGLRALCENAKSAGGATSIASSQHGTRIVVSLPMTEDQTAEN